MADEERINDLEAHESISEGPGEILVNARNRLGLSSEKVSQHLHLPFEVVKAIEDNRYDDLPEPTYVKGYIRSYARYVEVDPEPLIRTYVSHLKPLPQFSVEPQSHRLAKRRTGFGAFFSILGVVVVGGLIWWFYGFSLPTEFMNRVWMKVASDDSLDKEVESPLANVREVIESTVETSSSTEGPQKNATGVVALQEERVVSVKSTQMPVENPPESLSEIKDMPSQISVEAQTVRNLQPKPELEYPPDPDPEIVSESPSEPASESDSRATDDTQLASERRVTFELRGRIAPGDDKLQLTFKDQSWTEVYDANDERLLFGLMNAGATKKVEGTAPFRILLGNSPAVRIIFNGEPFDHSRFDRWDKTARFNVDSASAN